MDAIPTISMFYGILIRMYNDEHTRLIYTPFSANIKPRMILTETS